MRYARNLMANLRQAVDDYTDHVVAMQRGEVKFAGSPDEVFTAENIKTLFDMDVDVLDYKGKKLIVHHF